MLPYTLQSSNTTSVAEQLSSPTEKTGHIAHKSEFSSSWSRHLRVQAMKKVSQQQFVSNSLDAEREICDHIRAKEQRHTHQNGKVAGGKESLGGACADVRNGILVRKSRQKFVRRVVRAAPRLICQLQCGIDRDTHQDMPGRVRGPRARK